MASLLFTKDCECWNPANSTLEFQSLIFQQVSIYYKFDLLIGSAIDFHLFEAIINTDHLLGPVKLHLR